MYTGTCHRLLISISVAPNRRPGGGEAFYFSRSKPIVANLKSVSTAISPEYSWEKCVSRLPRLFKHAILDERIPILSTELSSALKGC